MLEGCLKEGILKVASEPVPESTMLGTRTCWQKTGCFTSQELFHGHWAVSQARSCFMGTGLFHKPGVVS